MWGVGQEAGPDMFAGKKVGGRRGISPAHPPLRGPLALPAMPKAQVCVQMCILFRGNPKSEINQLVAK